MSIRNLAIGTASMAVLAAAVCATPAIAQDPTELETIRVIAPSIIYRQQYQSGTAMPPGRIAEKTALVKFDDLNLKLSDDQRVLHERIAMTAEELCKDLAREVPKGSPSLPACTDQAIEESQAQVRQAVHLHSMRK